MHGEIMTAPLDLEAIKQRCEAATIPPWNDNGESGITQTKHITRDVWTIPRTIEDVTFIASARADIPALIAEVEALREKLALVICSYDESCLCGTCAMIRSLTEHGVADASG